jgi:hypothetical protein
MDDLLWDSWRPYFIIKHYNEKYQKIMEKEWRKYEIWFWSAEEIKSKDAQCQQVRWDVDHTG